MNNKNNNNNDILNNYIYFLGAGPGDPELLTRKGEKLLRSADVVIYTGSLINTELLDLTPTSCESYDSASLTKGEILTLMKKYYQEKKLVIRLHTGDPGLYSAIQEQIDALKEEDIPSRIVPGVSAYQGAMAALNRELTLPGVTQTVIITRLGKRTKVPEKERLEKLAQHESTLCIYLSTHVLGEVVDELVSAGLEENTPVSVIYKASWQDEQVIMGVLSDIESKVEQRGINNTALIIVGKALSPDSYQDSKLYDSDFTHGYRSKE